MAIGLREAATWDPCPVVGPAVLLGAPGTESASAALSELAGVATTEQIAGKRTEWKQLLQRELSLARQAQSELPALAPKREVEQAVVAVFLNSQPLGHQAYTPELLRLVGTGSPDGIELEKGLQRWRDLSWFLDDEDGGGTRPDGRRELPKSWRLGNRPNLRQMHDEAVRQRVSAEAVEERLVAAIRKAKSLTEGANSAGAQVHLLPQQPPDLPDDPRFRFAVLGPEAASESGKPSATAKRFLDETTRPDRPRVHRNTVVLAVPSREGLDAARTAARNLLGWAEVQAQLNEGGHAVDPIQQQRLKARLRDTGIRLPEAVRQAYGIVVTTDTENRAQAFKLNAAGGSLFAQIKQDPRSRIQETAVEPAALLPGGPYQLWKEPAPPAALDGNAVLRPRPEPVTPSGLLPESLPGAWTGEATNGVRLNQALSQARGETMPWGLVRESIRAAVNTRWLTVAGGAVDCAFDQAGQLRLERPAETPEPPSPPAVPTGALLELGELQDLADLAPDLASVAAGYSLRYRVRPELDGDADAPVRASVNERLAGISADLKVE